MRFGNQILFWFVAVLTLPSVGAGQNPSAPTLKVYSRETIVDVTVTDSKGNPVHGLKQEDFTVKEDNQPQPIRSFAEFGQSTATQPLPKLPPNVYTNFQSSLPSSALNILLLDGLNTAPTDSTAEEVAWSAEVQAQVKQAALEYLTNMPLGTRVAVLELSRSLRTLAGFTSDPELLKAAIAAVDIDMDGRGATPEQWCSQQDIRNRMTLEALSKIAADLMGIRGKKNLIWFSAGLPTITDSYVASLPVCTNIQQKGIDPLKGVQDQAEALQKTYSLLTAAQVTVYPISAQGLLSVEYSLGRGLQAPASGSAIEDHLSLESVAQATGGVAYYNTNDLSGAVAKAVQTGASYYTISYVPPGGKYDGSYHVISVKVSQPDVRLLYRKGYSAEDPELILHPPETLFGFVTRDTRPTGSTADPLIAALLSIAPSTQLLFDVEVKPSIGPSDPNGRRVLDPKTRESPLTPYGFQFAIPSRQIALTDGPNSTRLAGFEVGFTACDADGKLINSLVQSLKLPVTLDQATQRARTPLRFFQQLDLPPGTLFLRVGIRDLTSNKIGTLEIQLSVPKKSTAR